MKFFILFVAILSTICVNAKSGFSVDSLHKKGYSPIIEAGGCFGVGETNNSPPHLLPDRVKYSAWFSFLLSHGYRFNRHWYLGAGAAVNIAKDRFVIATQSGDHVKYVVLPIFIHARYNIIVKRFSPFIALKSGYNFLVIAPPSVWDKHCVGGPYLHAECGVSAYVTNKISVCMGVGYMVNGFIVHSTSIFTGVSQWDGDGYNPSLPTNDFTANKHVAKYWYHLISVMASVMF